VRSTQRACLTPPKATQCSWAPSSWQSYDARGRGLFDRLTPRQLEILEFLAGRRRRGQSPTGGPIPRGERLQDHSASFMCRHGRHRSPNQGETRHWAPSWPAGRPPRPIRRSDRPLRTEGCRRNMQRADPIRLPSTARSVTVGDTVHYRRVLQRVGGVVGDEASWRAALRSSRTAQCSTS
jgi:hypothetical protein